MYYIILKIHRSRKGYKQLFKDRSLNYKKLFATLNIQQIICFKANTRSFVRKIYDNTSKANFKIDQYLNGRPLAAIL